MKTAFMKASDVSSIRHSPSTTHQASEPFISVGRFSILVPEIHLAPSQSEGIPAAAKRMAD